MGKLNGVPIDQVGQICGQLLGLRQACPTHKNRNNRNIPLQGRSGFEPDEIHGILQPSPASFIFQIKPIPADKRQKNTAGGDLLINSLSEISSRLNIDDIHKDLVFPKEVDQIGVQPPRLPLGIFPAITHEDSPHGIA